LLFQWFNNVTIANRDDFLNGAIAWEIIAPSLIQKNLKQQYKQNARLFPAMIELLRGMLDNNPNKRLLVSQVIQCLTMLSQNKNDAYYKINHMVKKQFEPYEPSKIPATAANPLICSTRKVSSSKAKKKA